MPKSKPATCRQCGKHRSEVGTISRGGLCGPCGIERQVTTATEMAARSGPLWEIQQAAWRASMLRVLGTPGESPGGGEVAAEVG